MLWIKIDIFFQWNNNNLSGVFVQFSMMERGDISLLKSPPSLHPYARYDKFKNFSSLSLLWHGCLEKMYCEFCGLQFRFTKVGAMDFEYLEHGRGSLTKIQLWNLLAIWNSLAQLDRDIEDKPFLFHFFPLFQLLISPCILFCLPAFLSVWLPASKFQLLLVIFVIHKSLKIYYFVFFISWSYFLENCRSWNPFCFYFLFHLPTHSKSNFHLWKLSQKLTNFSSFTFCLQSLWSTFLRLIGVFFEHFGLI